MARKLHQGRILANGIVIEMKKFELTVFYFTQV